MIHRKLRPEKDGRDVTLCQWDPEKVKENKIAEEKEMVHGLQGSIS